ncbi:hypothetical protein B0A49_00652 [Cryomyces minteri]|uniref:Xylanolytic transcriptional activator regulatory domain-containing protein n=1 Tax=Cryomyces minteri TaxID=331657 RepID=A0A4U0XVJ3_9PEZI|nr:hypothetical protein B0A49_00652 [Cryomyces minteri]
MTTGPASQIYQLLNKELQKRICTIVVSSTEASLESIQALLVTACYSDKGWLLTSIATRMAVQLNLHGEYDEAVRLTASKDSLNSQNQGFKEANTDPESIRDCFRKARTWLGLFVLENIFSLDRGKAPSIEARDGIRRCRVLVAHPSRTSLDLRLLSQVELNYLRAGAHAELSATSHLGDADLVAFVQGIKIDLSIWLEDWLQIVGRNAAAESEEQHVMILNLRIQRDWAVIMICCRALQYTGVKNIAFMSKEQHDIMHMAKESAQSHFEKLLMNPKLYLAPFRYTMDFVWAKCAFSVLLLLKLAILLPETSDLPKLLADAKHLLEELSSIHGPRNVYYRILKLSIEKAEKALNAYMVQVAAVTDIAGRSELQNELASTFSGPQEAEFDFQTYVPKEFIFDWDFPA